MSEFENKLGETLAQRAEVAPSVAGLAEGARTRARRRRTTRIMAGASVAVVAMVAVPVGISALSVDDGGGVQVTNRPSVAGVPADWRWESWHDVEFAVPPAWGYGPLSQYCISSNSNPIVERPGGFSTQVACPKSFGYGVLVSAEGLAPDAEDATLYPEGATVSAATVEGVTVTAITADAQTAETITGSAASYPGADFYGCEAEVAVPALGDMAAGGDFARDAQIAVCRYEIGADGANLLGSEALTGDNIEKAWLGLDALQTGAGPNPEPGSCLPSSATEAVLLRSGGQDLAWVHYSGCSTHGVDVGGAVSRLNEQVMWTVISPNAGGFVSGGEVPLPKELRR
ncbi:MAG TPA: hypothetical protein VLI04_06190 [Nocardioidaceae bacterium]|nr:hypothetical protein [Nocardioidaceae bacterium]